MLFSIIVPIYNVEKYITECLESIINQPTKDYEIICVNDGSTDLSGEIVKNYQKKYGDKLVYVEQKNLGLSAARNTGNSIAKGDYICFVDSDDMLTDNALEVLSSAIEMHPDVQIINYEMDKLIFEGGQDDISKKEYYKVVHKYEGVMSGQKLLIDMLNNHEYVESANLLLINRQWLNVNKIAFTQGALYEDSIFSIDCFLKCENMLHLNAGIYQYRVRENSIMTSKYSFTQFKWRIWQFREVQKRIYEKYDNQLLQNALSEYGKSVLGSIRNTYMHLDYLERIKISELTGADELIVSTLGLNDADFINVDLELNGIFRKLENATGILIYGAGNVGNKIWRLINSLGMDSKIKKVVVSLLDREIIVGKHRVESIEDCNMEGVDLAIIATVNNQMEMYDRLKRYSDFEVIAISTNIEFVIDKYFEYLKSDLVKIRRLQSDCDLWSRE